MSDVRRRGYKRHTAKPPVMRPADGFAFVPHPRRLGEDVARLGCRLIPPRTDTTFCQAVMAA